MYRSKKFYYTNEDYNENGKTPETLLEEVMADSEFPELEEIVIGCWGDCWDDEEAGVQTIIDGIVQHQDQFSHIKSLFFGDMDFEECEVSWIIQGDYSRLWGAMPQLEKLTIKGSCDLRLGVIEHSSLKHLEIICGGLPVSVLRDIQRAKLPSLETLLLYLGLEEYGFDGNKDVIRTFLAGSDFPRLTYLGLTDSDIEDELAGLVLASKYAGQLQTVDLSMGCLTDRGGQILLDKVPSYPNIEKLILNYHFLSEEMMQKLMRMEGLDVYVEDRQEAYEYDGELWYYPMLGE